MSLVRSWTRNGGRTSASSYSQQPPPPPPPFYFSADSPNETTADIKQKIQVVYARRIDSTRARLHSKLDRVQHAPSRQQIRIHTHIHLYTHSKESRVPMSDFNRATKPHPNTPSFSRSAKPKPTDFDDDEWLALATAAPTHRIAMSDSAVLQLRIAPTRALTHMFRTCSEAMRPTQNREKKSVQTLRKMGRGNVEFLSLDTHNPPQALSPPPPQKKRQKQCIMRQKAGRQVDNSRLPSSFASPFELPLVSSASALQTPSLSTRPRGYDFALARSPSPNPNPP